MKIWALSDLHVGYRANREALATLRARPGDWMICCGDVGETLEHLRWTMGLLLERYERVIWTPGNHELWTHPNDAECPLRGRARYERLVEVCQELGVITPEDPYVQALGHTLVPLFLGYDYSMTPSEVPDPLAWAAEHGILSADERFLHYEPYTSRAAWTAARLAYTERRLEQVRGPTVLINHYPLRADLVRLFRIPRYIPWCGTRATERWHQRYRATVCVNGHLHMRATDWRDGVRFEEVALGYPRHWQAELGVDHYVREILPGPAERLQDAGPEWHR